MNNDGFKASFEEGYAIEVNELAPPMKFCVHLALAPKRLGELRNVLARGLNTWDDMPKWLCELDAMLAAKEEENDQPL